MHETFSTHVYDVLFRLTISTEASMMYMDSVKLIDVNGQGHFLTKIQVK